MKTSLLATLLILALACANNEVKNAATSRSATTLPNDSQAQEKSNLNSRILSYGRDGYKCVIESEFTSSTTLQRKIVERLGWKALEDKDGAKQPRSETLQLFKIIPNGQLQLISEQVDNYNFEQYSG